jgi:hypothetical protein
VIGAPETPYEGFFFNFLNVVFFKGGYYHGKLIFPQDFPFRPPSICNFFLILKIFKFFQICLLHQEDFKSTQDYVCQYLIFIQLVFLNYYENYI